jgi:hypothetical protein
MADEPIAAGSCLDPGDADEVAYQCVCEVTGSTRDFIPIDPLERYGVDTAEQCQVITGLVVGDENIGVRHYGCTMSANALRDLAPGWTIGQLSARIAASAEGIGP